MAVHAGSSSVHLLELEALMHPSALQRTTHAVLWTLILGSAAGFLVLFADAFYTTYLKHLCGG